jgi:aspartyl-tRNA(Asn)/glutamyl-tRNA(Gln) amidotransferase subunit C
VSEVPGGLSRAEVAHVAALARVELTAAELDSLTRELGAILAHAARISALDTDGVPPTAHPWPLVNVLRPDVPRAGLPPEEVLREAPEVEAERFRVPRILGDDR